MLPSHVGRGELVARRVEGGGGGAGHVCRAIGRAGDALLVVDRVHRAVLEPVRHSRHPGGVGVDGGVAQGVGAGGELIGRVVEGNGHAQVRIRAARRRRRGRRGGRAAAAVGIVRRVDRAPGLIESVVRGCAGVAGLVDGQHVPRRHGGAAGAVVGLVGVVRDVAVAVQAP